MNSEDLKVGETYYQYLGHGLGIKEIVYEGPGDGELLKFSARGGDPSRDPVLVHNGWMKSIFETKDQATIHSLKSLESLVLDNLKKYEKKLNSCNKKLEEIRSEMKTLMEKYPEEFV